MTGWYRILAGCCLGGLLACGGNAEGGASGGGGATSAGAGGRVIGPGAGAPSGGVAHGGATSSGGRGSGGTTSPFVDPECPSVEPEPGVFECDPLAPAQQCGPDMGCYPYVQHPFGDGCDVETYGSVCLPSGTGTQGALCGDGGVDCAAGYVCVIGAHAGRRCAKLCAFAGANECPPGMICGDTDIQGYGVCD